MTVQPMLVNGRPYVYGAATRTSHLVHVHIPTPAWMHVRHVRQVTRRKAQGHR